MKVENKTVIITDPCYIIKECKEENPYPYPDFSKVGTPAYEEAREKYYSWEHDHDDWDKCECGEYLEALGINNCLTSSTLYGDWSCTTYNTDTKEPIGKFCADTGMVSVMVLEEVRDYNPEIDDWIKNHSWCVTVIKDFTGEITIEKVDLEGTYTKNDEYEFNGKIYNKEGEHWEAEEVRVIGKGSINFFTTQTGL